MFWTIIELIRRKRDLFLTFNVYIDLLFMNSVMGKQLIPKKIGFSILCLFQNLSLCLKWCELFCLCTQLLKLCLILCNPADGSPPRLLCPWDSSGRILPFCSVQLLSHVCLFATPWTAARQASLSITNCWSLLKLMSIESVMPSNHLILCHPLFLLPSIFPNIRIFSSESIRHIRWPKYWSFSFSISLSNEHSRLFSFRIDWFDLAVQRTLMSLLQHHSCSKASVLLCSAFFMVQIYIHTRLLEKP